MNQFEKAIRLYWAGCLAYLMWCEAAYQVWTDTDL